MVAVPKERSFPRGGRQDQAQGSKKKVPDWCKNSSKMSDKKSHGRNRNKPFVRKPNAQAIPEETEANDKKSKVIHIRPYTGKLKYSGIAEGMLILGTVCRIRQYELTISLPGNCIGQVPIPNVSEYYTRALASLISKSSNSEVHHLQDMFHIGQHVVTKVVKKEALGSDDRHNIILSLAPEVLHLDCSGEDVLEGTVFTAAVASIQEKVYVMDLGIKAVRAFLNKENSAKFEKFWNKGKELGIGQIVRCLVSSVTTADLVTTVALTCDPETVGKASNNTIGSRLQGMLPGMLFNVTVARHVFPSGLQVRLSDNVMGYVPPNHLAKTFKKAEDFDVGSVHPARILYISSSGAIFFSMKLTLFPSRPPISPFKELKAGYVLTDSAIVWDVSEAGLTVKVGKKTDSSLKGVIPVKHINRKHAVNTDSESTLTEQLLNEFPIGSKLTCRIMDYCYMDQVYICTMDNDLMQEKYLHPSSLKVASLVSCIVKEISPKGIAVALGKKSPVIGFVPILHISSVPLLHPEKKFNVGQTCPAKVLSLHNGVHLTMKQPLIESNVHLTHFDNATVGKKYPGTVVLINEFGILVEFYSNVTSFIVRKNLGAPKAADLKQLFFLGHVVNCTVVLKKNETRKLQMSLVNKEDMLQDDDKEVQEANGEVNTDNAGSTKNGKKKEKKKKNVKDELNNAETSFDKPGALKRKKKQSMDPLDCQEPQSEITPSKKPKLSRKSIESGEDLNNAKKNRTLSTASMDSEVTPENANDLVKSPKKSKKKGKLSSGPMTETVITPAKSPKKSRKSKSGFEIKAETKSEDADRSAIHSVEEESSTKKKKKKNKSMCDNSTSKILEADINSDLLTSFEIKTSNSSKKAKKRKSSLKIGDDSVASITNGIVKKVKTEPNRGTPSTSSNVAIDSDSSDEEDPSDRPVELPPLSVATGFVWDATPNSLPAVAGESCAEESSDDELVETKKVKRSRQVIIAEKRLQAQIEEARLRAIEQRLMDPDQLPQTADEFDRLVLSSPDNSMVWLQYMAHHIQATEIEKARSIAQRALKTISFREEQEKLNVWTAWLNLENLYGTSESMKNTFEEAVRLNDPYQVYTQTLQIYADSHKLQDSDELIAVMTRKFKTKKDMWLNVATFYMKSGQTVKARALLQRALASVDKKEHVSVITQFALLENKLGTKERAQTLMEQILTSYPKRVDVWSVYVDMLIKSDLFDMARQVLERAVAQRLPSHKMKTLFKKFLSFEETHGSEEGAVRVRQLALDYVEAAAGTNME